MSSPQTTTQPTTLDPFAFPSDTTFRFLLLMLAVIGASLFFHDLLYTRFNLPRLIGQLDRCASFRNPERAADAGAAFDALFDCEAPFNLHQAQWIGALLAVQLLISAAIYWLVPAWKRYREQLLPLSAAEHPALVAALTQLCRQAGVQRVPAFVWNPLNASVGGLAFGHLGRKYVRLNGGLVSHFYRGYDRPTFDAVVLHELAHISNRDIDKTYFAVATTVAFGLCAVAPFLVWSLQSIAVQGGWADALNMSVRIAVLVLLVYGMLAAVLRAREVYADARAIRSGSSPTALARLFETTSVLRHRWWAIWSVHPPLAARSAVLGNTRVLLTMGWWDTVTVGLVASIAYPSTNNFIETVFRGFQIETPAVGLTGGSLFGALAAGVVVAGVWRSSYAAETERSTRRLALLALGFSLGVALGQALAFEAATLEVWSFGDARSALISFGLLLLSVLALFVWVQRGAHSWRRITAANAIPRGAYASSVLVASVALAICITMLFHLTLLSSAALSVGETFSLALWSFPSSIALVVLVGLAAVPLGPSVWADKPPAVSSAQYLGRLLRPGFACAVSCLCAIVFTLVLLSLHVWLYRHLGQDARQGDAFVRTYIEWALVQAAGAQVLAAATVAGLTRWLPAVRASVAVVMTAALIAVGVAIVQALGGCFEAISLLGQAECRPAVSWSSLTFIFLQVVSTGGSVALLVAAAVAGLARRFPQPVRGGILAGLVFAGLWFAAYTISAVALPSPPRGALWSAGWLLLATGCQTIAAGLAVRGRTHRYLAAAWLAAAVAAGIETVSVLGFELTAQWFGDQQMPAAVGNVLLVAVVPMGVLPVGTVVAGAARVRRRAIPDVASVADDIERSA